MNVLVFALFLYFVGFSVSGPIQNVWEKSGKYQGDMVLTKNQRNGMVSEFYRWPDRTLLYEFDLEVSDENRTYIESVLDYYNQETCVSVVPRNSTSQAHYVYITTADDGCWSDVGRLGGRQYLNLQPDICMQGDVILHQFLHALGFMHMQSSSDRDDYVKILWENVDPAHIYDFDTYGPEVITSFDEPYDLQSIMHFDAFAFSINGLPTIEALEPGAEVGGSTNLTEIDRSKLEKMYGC